jgi:GIY-YIG catalytic domain
MKKVYYTTNTKNLSLDWSKILGRTGPLLPAHRLANKFIKQDKPITAAEVNKVLAFSNIKISQTMLDEILKRPRLEFSNLDVDTIRSDYFLKNIGTIRGNIQIPGVYIWTHLSTGDKYVGSSSTLARRLIGYFKGTHKEIGKLMPLIKSNGIGAFKLEVLPLIESYSINQELSLEQYFLLHSEFNLNTLRVVNNFSGARAKPLYMYTKDLSELIYYSDVQEDFIFKLRIHHTIFTRSLKTGTYYLDKYVFTDKPILGAKENNYSIVEINKILDKDRLEIQNKSRRVFLKTVDGSDTKEFNSIIDCVDYLNTIAPSNKTTLYRHIKTGKPYQGYICELNKEEIRDIEVSVTHVASNETITYSSLRKAALSFEPKYKTTGQTIKTFANSGKLFKDEYKITIIKK